MRLTALQYQHGAWRPKWDLHINPAYVESIVETDGHWIITTASGAQHKVDEQSAARLAARIAEAGLA